MNFGVAALSMSFSNAGILGGGFLYDWGWKKERILAQDFEAVEKKGPWPFIIVGLVMTVLIYWLFNSCC